MTDRTFWILFTVSMALIAFAVWGAWYNVNFKA